MLILSCVVSINTGIVGKHRNYFRGCLPCCYSEHDNAYAEFNNVL